MNLSEVVIYMYFSIQIFEKLPLSIGKSNHWLLPLSSVNDVEVLQVAVLIPNHHHFHHSGQDTLNATGLSEESKAIITTSFLMDTKFSLQSKKENDFLDCGELQWCKYQHWRFFHFLNSMEAISVKAVYLLCCHSAGPCLEKLSFVNI